MVRIVFALLLATPFALAAPVPRPQDRGLYLPLAKGTKSVVEFSLGGSPLKEHTETVTQVESKDGTHTVTLLAESADSGRIPTPTVYEITADGVYLKRNGTEPPESVLKDGLKPGATWKDERMESGRVVVWATYTLGEAKEIEVPAGKFTAVPVTKEHTAGGKSTTWYARGVGVVKWEGEMRGSPASTVLKEFTPGKPAKR